MKFSLQLSHLQREIGYLHDDVIKHPVLEQITDIPTLQYFMEHDVFSLWDGMCLLKVLYSKMTCTQVPWYPPHDPESVYFIGQRMGEEEAHYFSNQNKAYLSHLDAYRRAMSSCGTNTAPIDTFLAQLQNGQSLSHALGASGVPLAAKQFVESTFTLFEQPVHQLAAVFVFAREGITGNFFSTLLKKKEAGVLALTPALQDYCERCVALYTDSHSPKALRMLEHVCGEDAIKWQEATQALRVALEARYDFWTAIESVLIATKKQY